MEDSGLAFAAAASHRPADGLAITHNSNPFAMQQINLPDTANRFAAPIRNHTVGHGTASTAQQASGSNSLCMATEAEVPQSQGDQMPPQAANETCLTSPSKTVPSKLEGSQIDYSALETPAHPTVDHGIESSVRDTLDMSLPDSGLFKAESLPQADLTHLELYASQEGPPTNGELPDPETMAYPSTPSVTNGAFTASPTVAEEEPSVHQAYAMLKFPDSYYYIKSTNVMITRDETYRRLYREGKKQKRLRIKMQRAAQQTLDDYAREPSHHSQYDGDDDDEDLKGRPARGPLSAYSDVGGAVSYTIKPDSGGYDNFDSAASIHRARKSKHNSSSNHSIAPRSLHEFEQGNELAGDLYLDKHGRAHDPHEWAQVAIHPQDPKDIEKISREHLIIRYDGDKRSWVMDVIGNRVLHNGQLRNRGDSNIDLSHDDEIIIISVSFRFMLPADEDADVMESVEYDDDMETSPAARRISETIDGIASDDDADSSEEDVPLAQQSKPKKKLKIKSPKGKGKEVKPAPLKLKLKNNQVSKNVDPKVADAPGKKDKAKGKAPAKSGEKTGGKAEPPLDQHASQAEPEASKPPVESTSEEKSVPSTEAQLVEFAQAPPPGPAPQVPPPTPINLDPNSAFAGADPSQLPQKRKGPGRPPKNGLISKRDDAGVKRKMKEYERQNLPPPPMNELLEMVRVEQRQKDAAAKAAARGEGTADMGVQNIDPRMQNHSLPYASAAPSQHAQSLPVGTGSPHDLPRTTAPSTSPRPRRPARSPSPMPAQESYSEEQLKKPSNTYVFIIDEILQDPALGGQADLQTIYDKIQKRWPYYKYCAPSNGWQSSVRHNLLQCHRFVESGKSGKGKYWAINFDYELDSKKRKQTTPPPPPPPQAQPQGVNGGPPHAQAYDVNGQHVGNMHNGPYDPGAHLGAGTSGGTQALASGHPANGPYSQQPQYGSQPPNGNRIPPQQPLTPQPFATIVHAIVAYKPQFLLPFQNKDKDTLAAAEQQFAKALNHYSDLHAGKTPLTEGQIDESQDPFRTMKQIFIQYGQGDTRGTQNSGAVSAPNDAPTANAVPAAPGAVTSHAPVTTAVPQVQPAQPMTNSHTSVAAPGINSSTAPPPTSSQQMQPPALSVSPPNSSAPGPSPSNMQACTARPTSTTSMHTAGITPVVDAASQSQPQTAPTQMQVPPPRSGTAGLQTGISPAAGVAPSFLNSAATSMSPLQNGQQQTNRVASPSPASLTRPPLASRPQQSANAGVLQPPFVPAHQPRPAFHPHSPAPQAGAKPGTLPKPTTSVVGGDMKAQQPLATTTSGPAPLVQLASAILPQQRTPSDQNVAQTDSKAVSPALPRENGLQAQSADQKDASQETMADFGSPSVGMNRLADHSAKDQAAERSNMLSLEQTADQNSALKTASCERPSSAGTKRAADESMDREAAKRLKTTQDPAARPAAP